MTHATATAHHHELIVLHQEKKDAIQQRLREFAAVDPGQYYYELVYCLLTPQSSAVHAARAVEALRRAERSGRNVDVAAILARKESYIRFHRTKAKRVQEARDHFPLIAARLTDGTGSHKLREWLVQNVKGLGWKEASHFLRNIGHRNLAILDRHILRNLREQGVIRVVPRSLTRKQYLAIEEKFAAFADRLLIPMDELDLLWWSKETGQLLK